MVKKLQSGSDGSNDSTCGGGAAAGESLVARTGGGPGDRGVGFDQVDLEDYAYSPISNRIFLRIIKHVSQDMTYFCIFLNFMIFSRDLGIDSVVVEVDAKAVVVAQRLSNPELSWAMLC